MQLIILQVKEKKYNPYGVLTTLAGYKASLFFTAQCYMKLTGRQEQNPQQQHGFWETILLSWLLPTTADNSTARTPFNGMFWKYVVVHFEISNVYSVSFGFFKLASAK